MLKLNLGKTSIVREIWFDLKFHSPISYEEFCNNPEYESIIDEESREWVSRAFTFRSFRSGWWYNDMRSYEVIMSEFLRYTYTETFENIYDFRYFPFMDRYEYEELLRWNIIDPNILHLCLNDVKHHITDNKFFTYDKKELHENGLYKHEVYKDVRVFAPYTINSMNQPGMWYLEIRKVIQDKIKFTQTHVSNKIASYLLFLNIVSDINLFIAINPINQSYIITDDIGLHKELISYFLCINVRNLLDALINRSSLEYVESLKEKYKHLREDKTLRVFSDLLEAIRSGMTRKIELDVSKWKVNHFDGEFREQNLDKRNSLKNFMSTGDGDITADTTVEQHNWVPSAIVWHRRIKYKNNKNNLNWFMN